MAKLYTFKGRSLGDRRVVKLTGKEHMGAVAPSRPRGPWHNVDVPTSYETDEQLALSNAKPI